MWNEVKLRGSFCEGGCCLVGPQAGSPGGAPRGWAGSPQSQRELKVASPQTGRGKGVLFLPASRSWKGGTVAQGMGG